MAHNKRNSTTPTSSKPQFTLDDFGLGRKLGEGKLGVVYRAKELKTGKIVVLKQMSKQAIRAEDLVHQMKRECEIHVRCRHKNIVVLHCWFMDEDSLYLVLEFCGGGTVFQRLQESPNHRFDESTAARLMRDVAVALHYLRTNFELPIIHRDIKPENILISKDPNTGKEIFKLADFGWAVAMTPASIRDTLCGTTEYLPPEVIHGESYSAAFDMWTLGVLLYESIVGYSPFMATVPNEETDEIIDEEEFEGLPEGEYNDLVIMNRIRRGCFSLPSFVSSEAADLIRSLLTLDPEERLTSLRKLLRHPWLVQHVGHTRLPPSKRGTALYKAAKEMVSKRSRPDASVDQNKTPNETTEMDSVQQLNKATKQLKEATQMDTAQQLKEATTTNKTNIDSTVTKRARISISKRNDSTKIQSDIPSQQTKNDSIQTMEIVKHKEDTMMNQLSMPEKQETDATQLTSRKKDKLKKETLEKKPIKNCIDAKKDVSVNETSIDAKKDVSMNASSIDAAVNTLSETQLRQPRRSKRLSRQRIVQTHENTTKDTNEKKQDKCIDPNSKHSSNKVSSTANMDRTKIQHTKTTHASSDRSVSATDENNGILKKNKVSSSVQVNPSTKIKNDQHNKLSQHQCIQTKSQTNSTLMHTTRTMKSQTNSTTLMHPMRTMKSQTNSTTLMHPTRTMKSTKNGTLTKPSDKSFLSSNSVNSRTNKATTVPNQTKNNIQKKYTNVSSRLTAPTASSTARTIGILNRSKHENIPQKRITNTKKHQSRMDLNRSTNHITQTMTKTIPKVIATRTRSRSRGQSTDLNVTSVL